MQEALGARWNYLYPTEEMQGQAQNNDLEKGIRAQRRSGGIEFNPRGMNPKGRACVLAEVIRAKSRPADRR